MFEQCRAGIPGHARRTLRQVVALQRRQRNALHVGDAQLRGERAVLGGDRVERRLRELDQVHLVDRQHHVTDAQQRDDVAVPAGLGQHALGRIDQHHRHIGGGGAGGHVAGVLRMPGAVGDDELAPVGIEIAVGNVDGDALLALGGQAIQQQRIVDGSAAGAVALAVDTERSQLVVEQPLAVVQQATDQRALAVVDAAAGDEAQQRLVFVLLQVGGDCVAAYGNREWGMGNGNSGLLRRARWRRCLLLHLRFPIPCSRFPAHQKYPSTFFCSIEAPGSWSMIRPWRSEVVACSISAMIFSRVSACDSIAPVNG
ncbi:hypothetical protein NB705_003736 [Xanthomonas sacchari]|nr:hypothetical protein [Xanthomonas sacchari]